MNTATKLLPICSLEKFSISFINTDMLFTSLTFFVFFALLIGLLLVVRSDQRKKDILLLASYIFYGFWDWRFVSLILLSTIIDYVLGNRIALSEDARMRKRFVIASIVINLGILGFFKYFNFFIESADRAFGGLGLNLSTLNIILPVGISFYTFQTLSYTIDIYRKKLEPARNFRDFALFVAFFPQLVAGPIVRASDFLPQLKNPVRLTMENFRIGAQIFLFGLLKKVVIADRMAFFADPVFSNPSLYDSATNWLAILAYALQIYCDFSGYSDMAIGAARILGFRLPINFNMPYASQSITEFWRRWHISLSSWLRDYLYIPLGGNRKGRVRTYINLMLTMLLGGLWHGASWHFVLWGGWHGLGLSIHKLISERKGIDEKSSFSLFSWIVTLFFILIGWVFFRAQNAEVALAMLTRMFVWENLAINWIFSPMYLIVPAVAIAHIIGYKWFQVKYPNVNLLSYSGATLFMFVLIGTVIFYFHNPQPFIYFQF